MFSNNDENRWHKKEQEELAKSEVERMLSPYAIPTLIIALSALVIGGILCL